MALWPFRKKSGRKRRRSTEEVEQGKAAKKQRTSPNKLVRRQYSFSPDQQESIRVRPRGAHLRRDGLPHSPSGANPESTDDDARRQAHTGGGGGGGGGSVYRGPTLHDKRNGDHLARRTSKKRRTTDRQREAEIKAMSQVVPHRPATEDWVAGRPMKRDIKRSRLPNFMSFRGSRQGWEREKRSSDVSLPAESLLSTMSSDSDPITFRVSALEALAPRPTLHFVTNTRVVSDGQKRPRRLSPTLAEPIPESTLRAHKRIDDLADALNASDLRELLERDWRRRERKRIRKQEKVERKLARRTEQRHEAERQAAREGRDSPAYLDRGVFGREVVGLGMDSTSAIVTSSRRRPSDASRTPSRQQSGKGLDEDRPRPLDAFHRTTSGLEEGDMPPHTLQQPVVDRLPVLAHSPGFLSRLKSRSKSPLSSVVKPTPSESSRIVSETSDRRITWRSLFRWSRSKRNSSAGPSTFSNTSRDSMLNQGLHPPPTPKTLMPRNLNAPTRTRSSRFREDLPELPLSRSVSRLQSPELELMPPTVAEASPRQESAISGAVQGSDVGVSPTQARHDTPTSGHRSIPREQETRSSLSWHDEASPEPQSMSLASIDSEASWLSGRAGKRRMPYHHVNRVYRNESETAVDDGSRLEPQNRESAIETRPSSALNEAEARWGVVREQHPTVVHEPAVDRMKSYEGMLKKYHEDEVVEGGERSNRNSHARRISAANSLQG